MDIKQKASIFAVLCALALSFSKFSVGLVSGSMTVVASGLDSLLDVFMSAMNFFAVRKAGQPADKEHHYGHGKAESIASSGQALFIILTGCLIVYKATQQFLKSKMIAYSAMDLGVMCLSLAFSFVISFVLGRIGRKTDSSALKADSLHYTSDLYSNSAAIFAIILTRLTGKAFFDLLFAAVTGVIIVASAFRILKEGISGLMDHSIPPDVEKEIASIIEAMPFPYAGYHKLRTRSSGSEKYMDFHLLACRTLRIDEAHDLAHQIERRVKEKFATADVTIHVEPCAQECGLSEETCTVIKVRGGKTRGKMRKETQKKDGKRISASRGRAGSGRDFSVSGTIRKKEHI